MIEHKCPVDGKIMVEKGKLCNWCSGFDEKEGKTEPYLKLVKNDRKDKIE